MNERLKLDPKIEEMWEAKKGSYPFVYDLVTRLDDCAKVIHEGANVMEQIYLNSKTRKDGLEWSKDAMAFQEYLVAIVGNIKAHVVQNTSVLTPEETASGIVVPEETDESPAGVPSFAVDSAPEGAKSKSKYVKE